MNRGDAASPGWTAAALPRLSRVPEPMRDGTRDRIEAMARQRSAPEITMEIVEAGLEDAGRAMQKAIGGKSDAFNPEVTESSMDEPRQSKCPFARLQPATAGTRTDDPSEQPAVLWTREAEKRMKRIPEGFMREMTRQRIETFARRHGVTTITPALVREKYAEWARGSAKQETSLDWDEAALERINRIPGFVRGMVIMEVERCAKEIGYGSVTDNVIDRATGAWQESGMFHSGASPDLYE